MTVCLTPVWTSNATIEAPGITAPVVSVTVPEMTPVIAAYAEATNNSIRTARENGDRRWYRIEFLLPELIGFGYLNNCDYVVLSSREEADLPEMLKTVIPLFEPLE